VDCYAAVDRSARSSSIAERWQRMGSTPSGSVSSRQELGVFGQRHRHRPVRSRRDCTFECRYAPQRTGRTRFLCRHLDQGRQPDLHVVDLRLLRVGRAGLHSHVHGTRVAWIGPKSIPYGKANVYIDGALKGTVDCYSAATGWRYKIWESAALPSGNHTIQVRPTHTKNAAATSFVVVVDAWT